MYFQWTRHGHRRASVNTKADCLNAFQGSDWYERLDARSHLIRSHGPAA